MKTILFLPLSVVPKHFICVRQLSFSRASYMRLMLVLGLLFTILNLQAREIKGRVVKVMDGDTIEILNNRTTYKIRLAGIDCPEKKQAFGMTAKSFTSNMVFGKHVLVKIENKDRYGRYVAFVFLSDGRNLNYELLKNGLAWHYKQYSKSRLMTDYEVSARTKRLGLWADKHPIPPWDYRKMKRTKHK